MKLVSFIVFLSMFLSACASSDTDIKISAPDRDVTIYSCIYDAMEETVLNRQWALWDSLQNNCATTSPHRGKMIVANIEHFKNRLCAQFFTHSQVYLYGKNNKWSDYKNTIITACFDEKTRWVFYKNDRILNKMVLDEIFGLSTLSYKND